MEVERELENHSSNLNLIFEDVRSLIENEDIPSLQYFLDELNEFLFKVCLQLRQEFDAVERTKHLLHLQVSSPFSHTYSSQTDDLFALSNFFLVPKNVNELKDKDLDDDFYEPFDLCETNLDQEDIKEEDGEDQEIKVNHKERKNKKIKITFEYRDNFPISKEQFDEMLEKGSPFSCSACNISFMQKKSIVRHLSKCKGIPMIWPKWRKDDSDNYFCEIESCSEQTIPFRNRKMIWKHHISNHAPQAEEKFECEICLKTFKNRSNLKQHFKYTHDTSVKSEFMCKYCGKGCKAKQTLQKHEATHLDAKPFMCSKCDFRTAARSSLLRHMKGVHDHSTQEVCDLCGKSFNTKNKLKNHMTNSHSDIGEKCPFCGKVMRNLKRHIFTAHKVSYPCPECPRVFQAQLGVDQHRKEVHGFGIFKSE